MKTVTAFLMATLSMSAAAQAATLTTRIENGNSLIISAKGGAHDEVCGGSVHFLYREPKAAKDSEKLEGFQRCSAKEVPARRVVEVCRLDYAGATDIEVKGAVDATCTSAAAPPPADKKTK